MLWVNDKYFINSSDLRFPALNKILPVFIKFNGLMPLNAACALRLLYFKWTIKCIAYAYVHVFFTQHSAVWVHRGWLKDRFWCAGMQCEIFTWNSMKVCNEQSDGYSKRLPHHRHIDGNYIYVLVWGWKQRIDAYRWTCLNRYCMQRAGCEYIFGGKIRASFTVFNNI